MHYIDKKGKSRGKTAEKDQLDTKLEADLVLAERAQKDPVATQQLINRIAPRVRQTVYLAVGPDQEADDLTHVCLIEILENLGGYKGTGSIDAWAGRLAYRVLMRQLSRRRREERTVAVTPFEVGITSRDPEFESTRYRLRNTLTTHLQKLPEKRRMTLILRLAYQYSVAEVAETMGVPINTARDRIRVGLKELRKSLLRDPQAREFLKGNSDE
jgi:RNA polymerase sigma-70 factor (ECF subfamily)